VSPRLAREEGTTLIEVVISSAILVTLMAGLMSLAGLALNTTENQGHLAARTTEYAQDKMEQLLALAYGDPSSDTTVFPAVTTGGTGLTVGGSSNTSTPVTKYVDYLDQSGNLCGSASALAASPSCAAPVGTTPPTNWFYQRVWSVESSATDATLPTNIKRITVAATVSRGFGGGNKALSVLTVLKTSPF
jgi:Tfp pilus assembly protein PilV